MKSSSDPSVHRQREQQLIEHVTRLLEDSRLRVDTTAGRRPAPTFRRQVIDADREVDLKRAMAEQGRPDRDLQARMPVGRTLDVNLSQRRWLIFNELVGRLRVVTAPPWKALIGEQAPQPMTAAELRQFLTSISVPADGVPTTLVVHSTGGFTIEAHELAERRADRTVILVEPNDSGGWSVNGPPETQALVELFDPESEESKRQRVREQIEQQQVELGASGLAADRLAGIVQLPLQMVESELKSYAKAHPGLAARRLDGRIVLFREGGATLSAGAAGDANMPFLQRIRALFSRKGENEKKVALLTERRVTLSQQRDRAYEEMTGMEQKESALKQEFKEAGSTLTKKRITSQLLQFRKDMERRQQLLGVLNQQINVLDTHLHTLQLVQQGQGASMPTAEEMADDAAKAEDVLSQLQESSELAGSIGLGGASGLSEEEQALFEELERENAPAPAPAAKAPGAAEAPAAETSGQPVAQRPAPAPAAPAPTRERRAEPEPG